MKDNDTTVRRGGLGRNQVAISGALAAVPEHRLFGSGASVARLLVTVRIEEPRPRTDVIPVTVWEPAQAVLDSVRGTRVDVVGQVHRRFWTDAEGRHSRVELVAVTVDVGDNTPPQ